MLDGVEVRAVRGKIEQPHPRILQTFADACNLVRREIVDDDDAADSHFWDQPFFEPLLEDLAVHRAWDQHWRKDAVMPETGYEGLGHPVAVGCLAEQLLAFLAPAMSAHHAGRRPGLIDEHETGKVEVRLRGRPQLASQGNIRPVLLRRKDRFF